MNREFRIYIQQLVESSQFIIDRPKGSTHPRFPDKDYPVDYGYLLGTTSNDSSEVDIWVGSENKHLVVGVLCTVDLLKRDTELKILVDCTDYEIHQILDFVNSDDMRALFIKL